MKFFFRVAAALLLVCAATGTFRVEASNSTKKIRILTMVPYPNPNPLFRPSWEDGRNIVPAMDLAASQVNERDGFLDGYQLELVHRDGGCNIVTTTSKGLVSGLFGDASGPVVGMIGPGCSRSAFVSLFAIGTQNRTSFIVVHGAGSPLFTRAVFPNSFGILGSSTVYVKSAFALMDKSSWRNVAVLVEGTRQFFTDTVRLFKQELPRRFPDANLVYSVLIYDFFIPLNELRDGSATRVVYVFGTLSISQKVICLALRSNLVYPRYQWVFVGHPFDEFLESEIEFMYNGTYYSCSIDELTAVASNGSIFLNFRLQHLEVDGLSFSGISHTEYFREYTNTIMEYNANSVNSSLSPSVWATYFYDAVWAWAIVLDNVTKSSNFSIEQLQFDQPNDALIQQFEEVDFEGVSGRIKFDSTTGSVDRVIDIVQVFDGNLEYVGYYSAGEIETVSGNLEFIDDTYPVLVIKVHPGAIVAVLIPLLVQCVAIITTHIVVVVNRKVKPVKASSPTLSHFSYLGVYFIIVGLVLVSIDYRLLADIGPNPICQIIWAFLFPYGLTLVYGTITVRTWRLYRLFCHTFNPGGRWISEPVLICFVFVLLSVNIIISIVWTTIDPLTEIHILDISDFANPVRRQYCDCQHYFVWLILTLCYTGLLLLALSALVCLTRNIDRNFFRTVTLQILVYGTLVVVILGLAIFYFAILERLHVNIVYISLGFTINIMLLIYFVCVLLPPVILLVKHKRINQKRGHQRLN